ncbi:MAG: HAD-IA family hydrolase [Anaerolineaceae bacterium]|nr:HAD-IA family hydrolase [Anaerolineaceae bacterium]
MEVKNLKAVLFDLDGTLINSHEIDKLTFIELLKEELGLEVTEKDFGRYTGTPVPKILMHFTSEEKAYGLTDAWVKHKLNFKGEMDLYPGVLDMLQKLKEAGLKLAIISSQLYEERVKIYSRFDLEKYFDSWITSDQTEHSKPHPEPVLKTLERLGVAPQEAIMVGDTFNDMEAGRRAGTFIGAAMWGFGDKDQIYSYHPDLIFNQVSELDSLSLLAEKNIQPE